MNAYTNFLRLVAAVGTTMENNHMVGRGGGSFADYAGDFPNHQHNISAEGGGGAHSNVQPYITFVKIIKLS
jgi:microcystin-dependent protein